jgi:hypothetical protein
MQSMRRQMFLLSVLSITFLLFLFFYLFGTSPKQPINFYPPDIIRPNLTESKLVQNDTEPIIFSKSEYLNRTRKVKLFLLSHCFFLLLYYCCSQVRMLLLS